VGLKASPNTAIFQCMTDKASPAGWVVQATIAAPLAEGSVWRGAGAPSAPSFRYFNVAIAASDKAVKATEDQLANTEARILEVRAVRPLSAAEIAVAALKTGEAKPA
jgi:hypothetical protein